MLVDLVQLISQLKSCRVMLHLCFPLDLIPYIGTPLDERHTAWYSPFPQGLAVSMSSRPFIDGLIFP